MSLRQLDYFVTAAEVGTMTGAAQRLYVSQSAVSAGIGELEHQLGVQLVIRAKAKGLTLTAAGRRLLPEARALLARSEELRADLREVGQAPAGRLVIGCFATLAPFLLPRLLEEFPGAYPDITLDFVEGSLTDLQRLLRNGDCELALIYGVDIEPGIDFDRLYSTEPHVLLASEHPLAGKEAVRLADLGDQEMVMLDVPPSSRYFSEVLADAGVTPVVRHRTESFELVRSLVARGAGYSLLIQRPALDVSYEGRGLRACRIADRVAPLSVGLAHTHGSHLTRRAAAFAAYCRTAVTGTRAAQGRVAKLPAPTPVTRAGWAHA
ncbi:LysR family transcriptional regulator [Streptomyces spinoverrucosus]|uniref:LysR family transcriptional regulator n=1 Tax=Streptomyces spinoverrucosus TaxID=284043 RepID=UPI0018C41DA9|nr:LysR family transcriptional regulator [Streptomyces spinoverrucosus]MBG0855453.1 LysR family transcriptional regulator [Streptomyces spinoverrucosus]